MRMQVRFRPLADKLMGPHLYAQNAPRILAKNVTVRR